MGNDGGWKMKGLIALLLALPMLAQADDSDVVCYSMSAYAVVIIEARHDGISIIDLMRVVESKDYLMVNNIGPKMVELAYQLPMPISKIEQDLQVYSFRKDIFNRCKANFKKT